MEVRWMTRINDQGEEEKFYPVTHINAIVDDNEVPIADAIGAVHAEVEATKKSVSDGKILVADAITAKGVTTATDATFATMAANIGSIDTLTTGTADATATAAQILAGQTAYVNGSKVTGSMTDYSIMDDTIGGYSSTYPNTPVHKGRSIGMQSTTVSGEQLVSIIPPAGYYNGSARVAVPASDLGTVTADKVLSGETFTSTAGIKKTGTMSAGLKMATGTVYSQYASYAQLSLSGTVSVAHGLGKKPTYVELMFNSSAANSCFSTSTGSSTQTPSGIGRASVTTDNPIRFFNSGTTISVYATDTNIGFTCSAAVYWWQSGGTATVTYRAFYE